MIYKFGFRLCELIQGGINLLFMEYCLLVLDAIILTQFLQLTLLILVHIIKGSNVKSSKLYQSDILELQWHSYCLLSYMYKNFKSSFCWNSLLKTNRKYTIEYLNQEKTHACNLPGSESKILESMKPYISLSHNLSIKILDKQNKMNQIIFYTWSY